MMRRRASDDLAYIFTFNKTLFVRPVKKKNELGVGVAPGHALEGLVAEPAYALQSVFE